MKKIIEKTETYIIYEDYTIEFVCSKCKRLETIPPEHKFNSLYNQNKDMLKGRVCLDCYKESKSGEKDKNGNNVQERIAYAQSWNLAVAMIAPAFSSVETTIVYKQLADKKGTSADEQVKAAIEELQKYFYDKLTNRDK